MIRENALSRSEFDVDYVILNQMSFKGSLCEQVGLSVIICVVFHFLFFCAFQEG